jgi:hypothetical protein
MGKTSEITILQIIAPEPEGGARDVTVENPARERRATPRVKVELQCTEQAGKTQFFFLTTDLSTFGLSTRHGPRYALGTRLQILLNLTDDPEKPLRLEAEVVGHHDEESGLRLAFRRLPVAAARRLHRFLADRQPAP